MLRLSRSLGFALILVAGTLPVSGFAQPIQQMMSDDATGVTLWVPETWVVHSWTLSNPGLSLLHVMDVSSGIAIAVEKRGCSEPPAREAWKAGDRIKEVLGNRVDDIRPAQEGTAELMPGAAAFITTSRRDTMTYRSHVFMRVEEDRCYLIQLISPEEIFEESRDVFAGLVEGIRLKEWPRSTATLAVSALDSSESAAVEIKTSTDETIREAVPFDRSVDDREWHALIRQVEGSGGLKVDFNGGESGWFMECTGSTVFVQRRDGWTFCTAM